jgi:NADP-dependent 3-hydroxy acid dehydrogenase YdfG
MSVEFEGMVALVTGAAYGLGRATARMLASRGAHVAVVDVDSIRGGETVKLIEEADGTALLIEADVRLEADVSRAYKKPSMRSAVWTSASTTPASPNPPVQPPSWTKPCSTTSSRRT